MRERIVFALVMSAITTCLISFVLVSVNLGWGPRFTAVWLRSWMIAYCIAVPMILYVGPVVATAVHTAMAKAKKEAV